MDVKRLINKINRVIKAGFPGFKGTFFFGSRSREDYSQDSDYDILLTFEHKPHWKEKNKIYDLIAEIELQEQITIDIKAYSEKELKTIWTPFREQVLTHGTFHAAN